MSTMEEYLNSLNLTSLKAIIRHHNLHQKIKMTGKREELIKRLLDHYDTVTNGNLRSKIFMTPKFDLPTPKRKPKGEEGEEGEKRQKKEKKTNSLFNLNIDYKEIQDLIKNTKKPRQTKEERDSIMARNEIKTAMKQKKANKKLIQAKDERMKTLISSLNAIKSKKHEDDIVRLRALDELIKIKDKKWTKESHAKFDEGVKKRRARAIEKDTIEHEKDKTNKLHIKIIPPIKGEEFYDPNFMKLSKIEQLETVLKTSTITGKQQNKKFYFDIADDFYKNLNVLLNRSPYGAVKEFVNKYQLTEENLLKIYEAKSSADFFPTGYDMVKQIFDSDIHYRRDEYNFLEGTAGIGNVGYWAQKINPNLKITMNELDTNNYEIMKLFNKRDDNMKLIHKDFFTIDNKQTDKYDLIFLNPPFGTIANKNPQLWFMFLLKALHMLQHNKGVAEILFISPEMVRDRRTREKDAQFTSILDLIKDGNSSGHEGTIPLSRWLKYVNEYDEKYIKSDAIFTKKDVIEAKTKYSGELYEYIDYHFRFNLAQSVTLKSNDFGGTKVNAYYTMFNLHNSNY